MIATAPLPPERTALLLVGVQEEHFLTGGPHEVPDGAEALDRAARLLLRARTTGTHVAHVRRVSDHPVFEDFRRDGPGAAIRPEVRPGPFEPVFDAEEDDAFAGTLLGEWLEVNGVEAVVIAGFSSGAACTATVTEAVERRLRTVVAADATAATARGAASARDVHERALAVQRRLGAEMLSARSVGRLLDAAAEGGVSGRSSRGLEVRPALAGVDQ